MGGFIVLVVLVAPRGLLGMLARRGDGSAPEGTHHG
jgi:branched-chain amino acid transport system permease protein